MFAFFTAASTLDLPHDLPAWAASPRGERGGRVLAAVRVRAIRRTRPAARGADETRTTAPFQFASGRVASPHAGSAHVGRSRIRPAVGARF